MLSLRQNKIMLTYIKRYPFSISIILVVTYLSLFRPPQIATALPLFEGADKLVHFLMYGGISFTLWFEFLLNRRREVLPMWHGWIGAVCCPILFSGGMELAQTYFTTYRSGDWLDLAFNIIGVFLATGFALWILPLFLKRKS